MPSSSRSRRCRSSWSPALTALFYYWRILPGLVSFFRVLEHTMKIGGASGIAAAANVFIGMIEAPLLIGPTSPDSIAVTFS